MSKRFIVEDDPKLEGNLISKKQRKVLGAWITEETQHISYKKINLNPTRMALDLQELFDNGYEILWKSKRSLPQSTSKNYDRISSIRPIEDTLPIQKEKIDNISSNTKKAISSNFLDNSDDEQYRRTGILSQPKVEEMRRVWIKDSPSSSHYDDFERDSIQEWEEYKRTHNTQPRKINFYINGTPYDKYNETFEKLKEDNKPWLANRDDI